MAALSNRTEMAAGPGIALMARQAIFNRAQDVFGYELLYRDSATASAAHITDMDQACRHAIVSAICDLGLETLVGRACAFVNLSAEVLLSNQVSVLSAKSIVIELLEDVPASDRVRAMVTAYEQNGYRVALDDFELDGPSAGLSDLADIIKVDVLGKSDSEVATMVERLRATTSAKLLAEKVETHREYQYYRDLGFDYFQGFFLCKPQMVSRTRVPRYKTAVLQLLAALEDASLPMAELERLVMRDASLS